MPSNPDFNLPSGENSLSLNKIYQGEDFDDAIINAMNASSEKVAADYGIDAGMHRRESNKNYDGDVEIGSFSRGSSDGSEADNMSLESDDMSMVSDSSDKNDNNDNDHHDSFVPHVPLVNDDESVMEMKNPAPVSQSVSSYVDQLNRKERGKSTLIKAGVFLIFIAIIVGVPLAVVSLTGNKSKGVSDDNVVVQSPGSQNDKNSPWANAGDENVLDNLFRSVEITMNGTLSLSGLAIPTGSIEAVKVVLGQAIAETVSNSLTQDQTVMDVTVKSIDDGGGRILFRVLEDGFSLVEYEMTVKEKCRDCNDNILQSMREALYQQVASDLIDAIDTGDFTDNLHKQAKNSGNNLLLSAIVIDGDFEAHSSLSTQPNNELSPALPTQPPTPQRIPAFTLPQLPPPPPTPPPSATIYVITRSPTTAPITPSPTLSPVTTSPATEAPFTLPPVEFVPTDPPVLTAPPVELLTLKPTKSPTKRPTARPTPRPTPR